MSLPAQNALPWSPRAPVSTTARTASSSVASRQAALNSSSIATVIAFSFSGRSIVIVATPSPTS